MLYESWTQFTPTFGNASYTLVVNEDRGSEIPVTIQCNESYTPGGGAFGIDWTMYLQRYEDQGYGNYEWTTIDTREGYCHADSWSNRTFTNIAQRGNMRIVLHSYTTENYRRVESTIWAGW